MRILICLILAVVLVSCSQRERPLITGSTSYTKSNDTTLTSSVDIEQRHILYKPTHQRYIVSVGSKLVIDIDHFGNEIHVNPYTTLGIDF